MRRATSSSLHMNLRKSYPGGSRWSINPQEATPPRVVPKRLSSQSEVRLGETLSRLYSCLLPTVRRDLPNLCRPSTGVSVIIVCGFTLAAFCRGLRYLHLDTATSLAVRNPTGFLSTALRDAEHSPVLQDGVSQRERRDSDFRPTPAAYEETYSTSTMVIRYPSVEPCC